MPLPDNSPKTAAPPGRNQQHRDGGTHSRANTDFIRAHNHAHVHKPTLPPHSHAYGPASEKTPLLHRAAHSEQSSRWLFWQPSSPSFRFFILALAMLIPFGPHLVKSCLSSLASYFLSSPTFPLSHTQFGSFQSALSLPNLFVPFLGGLLLDLRGSPSGTVLFLAFTLAGHSLFTLACQARTFGAALAARALFGLGQGSTVVAQGRIAAVYFRGHEMVFAIAVCESLHNLSALIARLYVVPMAEWSGTYIASLWVGVVACALSMVAGLVYWYIDPHVRQEEQRITAAEKEAEPTNGESAEDEDDNLSELPDEAALAASTLEKSTVSLSTSISTDSLPSTSSTSTSRPASVTSLLRRRTLPISFILLCLLHLVHSNSYHLFDYISANFLQTKYNTTIMHSAVLSSITSCTAIILCPIAGYLLDHTGYKMYVVCLCSVFTCGAFLLMALTCITPWIPLVMLSLSISFVPTILRSAVPDCAPASFIGTAYGAYEVMESIGAVIGHVGVGLLVDFSGGYTGPLLVFAAMAAMSGILAAVMSVYDRAVGGTLNEKSDRTERRRRARVANEQIARQKAASKEEHDRRRAYADVSDEDIDSVAENGGRRLERV